MASYDAETFDPTKRQQRLLEKATYFTEVGNLNARAFRKLEKTGLTAEQIAEQVASGNYDPASWFSRTSTKGAVGGRMASLRSARYATAQNLKEADRVAELARTQGLDAISRGFSTLPQQLQASLAGPIDPNSATFQAIASNWLAQRQGSQQGAMNDINMNLARERSNIRNLGTQYDVNLLTSIGDTVEMLRALREQEKLAKSQMRGAAYSNPFSLMAMGYSGGNISLPTAASFGQGMFNTAGSIASIMAMLSGLGGGGGTQGSTMTPSSGSPWGTANLEQPRL